MALVKKLVVKETFKKKHMLTAVDKAAAAIRKDVLAKEDGKLLGSEEELIARYGISRPTLRQAASQVSQDQLLTVRRGVGGGYFTRRPEAKMVSRMAALYLKVHEAELAEIVSAFVPIRVELARLAAGCKDKILREKLIKFLQHEHEIDEDPHFRDFVTGERKFNSILGRMGGNKALSLFLEILLDLASMVDREEDMYRNHPHRVATFRGERNKLAAAIVDGDEEMATLIARRCASLSLGWLMDDLVDRVKRTPQRNGSALKSAEFNFEF